MKIRHLLLLIGLPAILLSACAGEENEPMPQSTVSRLYVSVNVPDASIAIFDPADGPTLSEAYLFNSLLPDAQGILFDPYSGTVFQVSRLNRNLKTFTVKTDGTLTPKNSFIDEAVPGAGKLAFDRNRNILYLSSSSDSSIYVYTQALTLNGTVVANKKFKLDGEPRDIHFNNDQLYVVIGGDRAEIQLFESVSSLVSGSVDPVKTITVSGAVSLEGICYAATRDALMLTGIAGPQQTGPNSNPAIYLIDDATAHFAAGAVVNAARKIAGPDTGLDIPVDIAIDEREGADLLYIAESGGKKILTFPFSGNGNITPRVSHDLNASPRAIFLDAR